MATSIDLILAPREVKTVTLSEAGVIQNKNIPSGLKVGDVVILMNEYVNVDAGSITIENLGWTHAFLSNTGTVPPAISAEAVYLSSADLAIVGTANNPALSYTTNPEASDGYTTSWQVITDEGATPSVSIGEDGKWSVLTEDGGSSIQVTLTNQDGTVVTDSSGIHPSTLGVTTDSTDDINIGEQFQLTFSINPEEILGNSELSLNYTTTDGSLVMINNKGLATGLGDGFARIGVEAEYRGASASDRSGITINTPTNIITDENFTSIGASGGAAASWISGNVSNITTDSDGGINGGNAAIVPYNWNLMGLYNIQSSGWIISPATPTDVIDIGNGWEKATITATIPAGCTSIRFYSMRQDTVNYIYTICSVTAGTTYKFSLFRKNTGGSLVCSLAQGIAQ